MTLRLPPFAQINVSYFLLGETSYKDNIPSLSILFLCMKYTHTFLPLLFGFHLFSLSLSSIHQVISRLPFRCYVI